jgi:predicted nucleic acid-binding Zn ribbon protein
MAVIAKLLMLMAAGFALFSFYRMFESWLAGRGQESMVELDEDAARLRELAIAKAQTVRDIKDLQFDYETGHLAKEEYVGLRKRLEGRGIAVLKRMDELRGAVDYDAVIDEELDLRLGHGGAARRSPQGSACGGCGGNVEPNARFCCECGMAVPAGTGCTLCGAALDADARFCSGCGSPVPGEVARADVRAGTEPVGVEV